MQFTSLTSLSRLMEKLWVEWEAGHVTSSVAVKSRFLMCINWSRLIVTDYLQACWSSPVQSQYPSFNTGELKINVLLPTSRM